MTIALAALEMGLLAIATFGTILVWFHPPLLDYMDLLTYAGQAAILALSCIISFYYNDLYDIRKVRTFSEYAARLLQALGVSFITLAVFYSLFPDLQLGRGPLFSSLLFLVVLVLPIRGVFYLLMKRRAFSERVLVLGTSPLAFRIVAEMEANPHLGYAVCGVVDDGRHIQPLPSPLPEFQLLGSIEEFDRIVEQAHPDRIVAAMSERRGRLPVHLLLNIRMQGVVVEDGIEAYERLSGKLAVESLTPSYLIFSKDFEKPRMQTAIRRAVSLVIAVIGLILTAPLMVLIGILVKLDSKGPVIFVQERIGLKGRVFYLMKFRTMHTSRTARSEWIKDNSDRLTRVGKLLRKFRLDELPQFLNILRGDMNIIGPRPHPASNVALFNEKIPYYSLRHIIRPGITGWAQVRYGYANDLEEETEKIRHDLYYIKHMSPLFDLKILIDTVKIVLFGRGSRQPNAYETLAPIEADRG